MTHLPELPDARVELDALRPTIHEIRARTVLNRVRPPMPFRWSANPYRGCVHACAYCYARPSHIAFDLDGGAEFEQHIFVKVNAPEVLRAELRRPGWRREAVTLGTTVDPYQPVEGRYRITRGMLAQLAAARTPATIITKNSMVQRDIDVLQALRARAGCAVLLSITSLDAALLRRMEPGTPPPLKRLDTLRRLMEAGIPAGVMAAPLLPGITDGAESLAALAAAAADHGACFFMAGALRLGAGTSHRSAIKGAFGIAINKPAVAPARIHRGAALRAMVQDDAPPRALLHHDGDVAADAAHPDSDLGVARGRIPPGGRGGRRRALVGVPRPVLAFAGAATRPTRGLRIKNSPYMRHGGQ